MILCPRHNDRTDIMAGWVLWTNVSITRRKSYFLVTDPSETTCFRHRHFWPCIQWLAAEDVECYTITPSEYDGPEVSPLIVKFGKVDTWQN